MKQGDVDICICHKADLPACPLFGAIGREANVEQAALARPGS